MNIPNLVTLSRLVITVPVFLTIELGRWEWALFFFVVGSISDYLDGFLARKLNQVTSVGKVIDQIVDKIFVNSTLIALIPIVPAWLVALIVSRDIVVSAVRILVASRGTIVQANLYGKVKTVTQMVLVVAVLTFRSFTLSLDLIELILIYLCAFFTLLSAIVYVYQNKKALGG
ncbi:CDP-diacylglycerol--glycerol-3-phosphate 3-phosphatidyltransferase [Pseudothermotoga sp.]|nr:CDP-diacylglycerol--glycerol-3-phosphate 3-phosphatidyltransferase [Pseudothermotoga sp.]MCX7812619.1 CDP-diacylglycerol--glycerol-3-phosphate 3-phosphatidyltransferase [Pseudothermotoga sp.]MDW8138899.1 CDP-diacylglycerol--glycerol-3-phosphate 3-phosphatidyltransferase [Pseudothermotoga sp.]